MSKMRQMDSFNQYRLILFCVYLEEPIGLKEIQVMGSVNFSLKSFKPLPRPL